MGRPCSTAASWLVWLSIAFGGFLLGIGNAVTGALGTVDHSLHMAAAQAPVESPDKHQHHHHHHEMAASAAAHRAPAAATNKQPAAATNKQPAAATNKQPAAATNKQPAAATHKPPTVSAAFMEALPAHCLFCLDGITPPPISVLDVELLSLTTLAAQWRDAMPRAQPSRRRVNLFDARGPPATPEAMS